MASVTIRNLDEETKHRLKIRAAQNNRSLEEELRIALRSLADNGSHNMLPSADAGYETADEARVPVHFVNDDLDFSPPYTPNKETMFSEYIQISPEVRFGRPCVKGTRISVYDVLGYLASGMSITEIAEDFPELSPEAIQACLQFAASRERRIFSV